MGGPGLRQAATLSMSKAHYFAAQLEKELGWKRLHTGEFFDEFAAECPDPDGALRRLEEHGILGGLPVEGGLLWCVTELASKQQLDGVIEILREVNG